MLNFLTNTYNLFIQMAPYLLIGFFLAGVLFVAIPRNRLVEILGTPGIMSSIKAALIGVPLPLCSCSVIPTAISLRKNGASKSSIMSFLISTPQTGADSIIITYSFLGPVFAVFRVIFAFISGIMGGLFYFLISKEKKSVIIKAKDKNVNNIKTSFIQKLKTIFNYGYVNLLNDIAFHLILGILVAGIISTFIPANIIKSSVSGLTGKLIMIAIGIPMYICSTASIPIAIALILKGVSPGTAFVFLMAGPATNIASLIVISKSISKKFAFSMTGILILFSLLGGIILDFTYSLLPAGFIPEKAKITKIFPHTLLIIFAIIFALLLLKSIVKQIVGYFNKRSITNCTDGNCNIDKGDNMNNNDITITIDGMTCNHCKMAVEKAIKTVENVQKVQVMLEQGKAVISGNSPNINAIKSAVIEAGYEIK